MLEKFTQNDWKRIEETYGAWWERKIDRAVINLRFTGKDPGMKRPEGLITDIQFQYPLDEPAELVAEKAEYLMRCKEYVFDAYPFTWLYLGPIWEVEMFGTKAHIERDTVWYSSNNKLNPNELTMKFNPKSEFFPRALELYTAFSERFGDSYVATNISTGGNCLDCVVEFFESSEALYMLYDYPEDVNRLSLECHKESERLSKMFIESIKKPRGYSCWGGLFAPIPWKAMQCDFSAMISPEHFKEYVLWDLQLCCKESPNHNYYHLDGSGQIPHLDMLLEIEELKCIQWVPTNIATMSEWPDLFRRISDAGKNLWILGGIDDVLVVADQIGTTKGIYWEGTYPIEDQDDIMKKAEQLI